MASPAKWPNDTAPRLRSRLARAAGLFPLREPRCRHGGDPNRAPMELAKAGGEDREFLVVKI